MTVRNYSLVPVVAAAILMASVAAVGGSPAGYAKSKPIDIRSGVQSKKPVTKLPAVQKAGPKAYSPGRLKRPLIVNPGLKRYKGKLIAPMYRPSEKSK